MQRDNCRTWRHGTAVHDRFPSQAGVNVVNKLPNLINSTAKLKALKTFIESAMIFEELHSTDEFMHGTQLIEIHDLLTVGKSGMIWNDWEFG